MEGKRSRWRKGMAFANGCPGDCNFPRPRKLFTAELAEVPVLIREEAPLTTHFNTCGYCGTTWYFLLTEDYLYNKRLRRIFHLIRESDKGSWVNPPRPVFSR